MPEYLAPGVYVEEVPSGSRPIEGVDTSTTGFVGAARAGPLDVAVGPLGSFADFQREFGGSDTLPGPAGSAVPNFLWHAARSFFLEGGRRLWVARVAGAESVAEGGWPRACDFDRGLAALDAVPDIAMIAAPGGTFLGAGAVEDEPTVVASSLIAHAERMRYRIAVIDSPDGLSVDQVKAWRSRLVSSRATLNYPWIKVSESAGRGELLLPPSGFVTGIYARNDRELGVSKPPASDVLHGAMGVEVHLDAEQQSALAREGINCMRRFPDATIRLSGARTLSADPDWKYVNVRRYLLYLEASLSRGLQWAVFEPNGDGLWRNVRRTVADFLFAEWSSGALVGNKDEAALFVRCDHSTMTQDDIDSGRVVVLLGIALLRPSEFVNLRVIVQTGCNAC